MSGAGVNNSPSKTTSSQKGPQAAGRGDLPVGGVIAAESAEKLQAEHRAREVASLDFDLWREIFLSSLEGSAGAVDAQSGRATGEIVSYAEDIADEAVRLIARRAKAAGRE